VLAYDTLDVANYDAVRAFCDQITAAHGSCDIIMNIAGIAIWGDITRLEHKHWKAVIDVNLMGPIHVMECLVPPMVAAGRGGNIVNVSSAAGLFALPWHAAYSGSKFGLRGISEVLRFDLKRHNIHVHVVCPGAVDTGLVRTLNIVGIDQNDPEVVKMRKHFQGHAVTPDAAAKSILRGIRKNRFIIYTSADIWVGYFFKRKFAWPYELVIGYITQRMLKLADRQWRKTK
jgi:NAD(P)-dependent dehydrogenase (short-subunit alcohol dehydrogenase family)